MKYCFDAFELDEDRGLLIGPEGEVSLRPQIFRLLELLVQEAPGVVSQQRLMDEVWGAAHLCSSSLPRGICELRNALGDEARKPRYIETVHRRGYRFVGMVEKRKVAEPEPVATAQPAEESAPRVDPGKPSAGSGAAAAPVPAEAGLPSPEARAGSSGAATRDRRLPVGFVVFAIAVLVLASGWLLRQKSSEAGGVPAALPLARSHPVAKKPLDPLDLLEAEHWQRFGLGAPTLDRDGTVDPAAAIETLRAALVREPESASLWFQLGRAWQEMGRVQEGREAAARSLDLSAGLPWEGRLMISALGDELGGDIYRAAARYRSLYEAHPDHIGLGLTLVRASREGGRPVRTLALLEDLAKGPLAESPRLHLEKAETCELLGDFECMLASAERAAEATSTGGSPWLRARALDSLAAARQHLEPGAGVEGLFTQAEKTFEAYGLSSRLLRVWHHRAEALALDGELDRARLHAEQMIGVARRMENRKELAWGLHLVGVVRATRAADPAVDPAEGEAARMLFEQAIDSFRAAGHLGGLAASRHELAKLHRDGGRSELALVFYQQALEAFEELGAERTRQIVSAELGALRRSLGHGEEAQQISPTD